MRATIGRVTLAAAAVAIVLSSPAQAGCKPACKQGEVCRYDSTKTPEFWCESTAKKTTGAKKTLSAGGAGKQPTQSITPNGK